MGVWAQTIYKEIKRVMKKDTCSEVMSMENCYKQELSQMSSDQCYYRVRLNTKRMTSIIIRLGST
jgi:hypothetical protein